MDIILKKEWCGFLPGEKASVSERRGKHLVKIGIAEDAEKKPADKKKPVKKTTKKTAE